jgi:hypothetical protein
VLSLLIASVLASPTICPDAAQLRWDKFAMSVSTESGSVQISERLYDVDDDAKPSIGDLFHVDQARRSQGKFVIEQPWLLIDGALADVFKEEFSKMGKQLSTICDTRFEISDVPRVASARGPGPFVHDKFDSDAKAPAKSQRRRAPPPPSRLERLNARMRGWAKKLCDGSRNVPEPQIVDTLIQKTREAYPSIFKRSTMHREAVAVTKIYSLKCVKFALGNLTF